MIVRVSWKEHDREYTIGVQNFLKMLGYDVDDAEIKKAIKEHLSTHD